jgi:polyhydroxyalkanoate synthesis regulator protein
VPKPVTIIRYPNRKLYVRGRGYVSLDDVYAYHTQGNTFHVIDSKAGQDVTAVILARVVAHLAMRGTVTQAMVRLALP